MAMFIIKILFGAALIWAAKMIAAQRKQQGPGSGEDPENDLGRRRRDYGDRMSTWWIGPAALACRVLGVFLIAWAVLGTSFIWVKSNNVATMKRVYFGKALPAGKIVATDGEMGPQARILTAGFHIVPLITLINEVDYEPVFTVPPGQCAIISAKDGVPIAGGGAFADPFRPGEASKMVNDAEYFLRNGGQRGPQTSVLQPGSYTLNPFLWEKARLIPATRVEQGTVGVVKSSVHAAVDFGSFKHEKPTNMAPTMMKGKLTEGSASVNIVSAGGIGVWEEPLLPNLYYINTDAYKVTHVPVAAMVFEYKGGYTRRTIEIKVDDKTGSISQKESVSEIQPVPEAADTAIFVKPEGWDVAQELRVLAQISPSYAPLVVSGLGLTDQNAIKVIDDRVVTPVIRSVVRDVLGGKSVKITSSQVVETNQVLTVNGKSVTNAVPVLNEKGEPVTRVVQEFRPVKVLDLLENRASLEEAVEKLAKPEAEKEFVTILECRFAESSIPPELLVARKREQLAQQILKAWKQEELSQTQRQQTENQRAQAEQQSEVVKAQIQKQAAEMIADSIKIKAEGEKAALLAIAEGQKAQKEILGDAATVELRKYELALKLITDLAKENPQIITSALSSMSKFVPEVVVNNGGGGNGFSMEGAMAVLGHYFKQSPKAVDSKVTPVAPAK